MFFVLLSIVYAYESNKKEEIFGLPDEWDWRKPVVKRIFLVNDERYHDWINKLLCWWNGIYYSDHFADTMTCGLFDWNRHKLANLDSN